MYVCEESNLFRMVLLSIYQFNNLLTIMLTRQAADVK